ncbi:TBC1 domain family member 17 [Camelus dromedarius]|uniref:TBC1 domain family member 17 n=1 Tax=Camelus dromedarius TaxID=9838 RepID=A0A5N4E629_CAMDR|nr:TBC1 domain family member 17 [Camelus dromedarius]
MTSCLFEQWQHMTGKEEESSGCPNSGDKRLLHIPSGGAEMVEPESLLTLKVSKLEKDVIFTPRDTYLHTSAKKHQEQDSLIAGIIRVVEDNDILLHWASAQEARDSTQILFSKKDTGAGDSCTSEEELTFDQDYEPDGAVFSTVQPWPRHSQSTRGAEPSSRRGFWAFSDHLFCLVFLRDSSALSNSFHHLQLFDQASSNVVSRFLQDSCSTTFSSVSRVTNSSRNSEEIMKRQLEQLLKLLQRDLQAHNGLTTKPSVEDALIRAEALYSPLTACHVSP